MLKDESPAEIYEALENARSEFERDQKILEIEQKIEEMEADVKRCEAQGDVDGSIAASIVADALRQILNEVA